MDKIKITKDNIEEYKSGKYDNIISIVWKYGKFENLSVNIIFF